MENGTQLTFVELDQEIYQKPSVTVSAFLVRLSALLETDEVLKIHEELYSLKLCDLLKKDTLKYYSLKMLQDYSTTMGGATFQTIITTMAQLGYSVEWQVLNSRYFGVPQNRARVFIVGHFGDGSGSQIFPIATDSNEADKQRALNDDNTILMASTNPQRPNRLNKVAGTIIKEYDTVGKYERPYVVEK